jgi:hypothetical protein
MDSAKTFRGKECNDLSEHLPRLCATRAAGSTAGLQAGKAASEWEAHSPYASILPRCRETLDGPSLRIPCPLLVLGMKQAWSLHPSERSSEFRKGAEVLVTVCNHWKCLLLQPIHWPTFEKLRRANAALHHVLRTSVFQTTKSSLL